MEKTPRYTQRERNMVLGYAAQYKDVIENKRTDAESNRKKDEVWLQIAKEFNSKVYHQRSAKQLRQLYKNMKLLLKKDLCGEDKGNRSFMDLLNTLSQQESVAQYIAEQMSPDGGGGSQANGNGRHLADDYEDSKLPMYEGMDTEVIMIKSETISDNEQTENGMDCMDDDDDDDCPLPKAPEVCLEEEDDEVLFATDLRQLQQQNAGNSLPGSNMANGLLTNNNSSNNNNNSDPLPRAASSPVCSTKTSISSTGSYLSAGAPKAEITLSTVGNIRVGAFASINKTLQNGSVSSSNNNNNSSSNNNNSNGQLTAEQMQQHLLLNGLGLSAVQHPSPHSLQAAINAATSGVGSSRHATQTLQLPRLARSHNAAAAAAATTTTTAAAAAATTAAAAAAATAAAAAAAAQVATNGGNNSGNNSNGIQLLLNGRDKTHSQHLQHQHQSNNSLSDSFNGFNGLNVASIHSSNINNNNCNTNATNASNSSINSSRGQHNEYMLSLALEERQRKIELLNAQIEYWKTLTKKLNANAGHYPNPACLCHFPGNVDVGGHVGVGVVAGGAGGVATATVNALQTQSSSS